MALSEMTRKQYRAKHAAEFTKPDDIELDPVPPVRITVSMHMGADVEILSYTLSDVERMNPGEAVIEAGAKLAMRTFESLEISRLSAAPKDLPTQATHTQPFFPTSEEDGHHVGVDKESFRLWERGDRSVKPAEYTQVIAPVED